MKDCEYEGCPQSFVGPHETLGDSDHFEDGLYHPLCKLAKNMEGRIIRALQPRAPQEGERDAE